MGKSTIVKLVALQLQKTNDYHILPIMFPKDIVKYFDPNIKQIYIIDDICGKFSVDQSMINSWERVNRQILKYRKDNTEFRVLGTCRLEISISSPFRKLRKIYGITECNLLQEKFVYSKEEKLKIAACHIDEEIIKQLDDKILNAYNMFPLLCMMYAASESNPGVRFFEYPLQAIEEQLDEMKEQNECHFIGLALIVVYNNKLHKLLLQNRNDQKFEDVFNDVFEDLGLVNRPSKRSVLSGLQTLEGIYVKELESRITVIHDKIFDILSLYFGKRIPKTILTHGSGTFIAERFLFESVKDDLKIVLPSELEDSYFNRMVEEIENNRFYNVFKNVQVYNELYQQKFITFLSEHVHQSIVQKLLYNKWPLYLSAVNGCKLLVQFILNGKRTNGMCNKLDKDGNHQDMLKYKPKSDMYACSYDSDTNSESKSKNEWDFYDTKDDKRTTEEDVDRIQFDGKHQDMLMDKPESNMYACSIDTDNDESTTEFYDTDHDDDDKRNTKEDVDRIQFENLPMVAACEGGYIDIVECLIENGYNIDHSDSDLRIPTPYNIDHSHNNLPTPLFSACKYGNKDVVDFLLKKNCKVDAINEYGQIALHAACENGKIDIVNSLLNCNSNMNQCDFYGSTPLYNACINGHTDIVQIFLDNNCDIPDDTIYGACVGGYKDIVEILINLNVDFNQHSGFFNETPIYSACSNGHTDIVQILLDNYCDIHGAIHIACRGGYKDIVEILIKHNVDINQRGGLFHTTPIYSACSNGHTDIVQILLDNNCDIHGAIHGACEGGHKDIVEILMKHNVDINQHGGELDTTPIYYACSKGHTDIVQILLDNNCDIHGAIHGACEGGHKDIVEILMKHNVDINQHGGELDTTPIYYACSKGHTDVVQILLDNNCDIHNAINGACEGGYKDIVEILINYNVDINLLCCSFDGVSYCTPIVFACRKGHTDIVKLLLDNNCDVLDNNEFSDALDFACEGSFVDIVDLLLRNNCNINQCKPVTSQSPLIVACHRNKEAVVKLLLSYEACDVNIIDNNNCNALHYACRSGQSDVVELLLKHHCNVNLKDKEMKTPLFVACEEVHVDIVKMLINQVNCMIDVLDVEGNGLLHATCGQSCRSDNYKREEMYSTKNGCIEIIGILLGKSCDMNVLNNEGQSELHVACKYGDTEIVDILLRSNSNVNQCDKAKKTPLFIACQNGCIDIVRLLIESKCEMFNHSLNGQTVLHAVCSRSDRSNTYYQNYRSKRYYQRYRTEGYYLELFEIFIQDYKDILTLLIDKKCDVNISDNNSQTPLHIACYEGKVALVEILLRNKCECDVNISDNNSQTPLHIACYKGNVALVEILLRHKCECDVNISDHNSQTPLHIACYKGKVALVEILLRNKCVVDQCDNLNKTPFFLACEEGHKDVVKSLMDNNCNMHIVDKIGRSALHAVCTTDSLFGSAGDGVDIAELLINKRCGVYDLDDAGQSALHGACKQDNPGIVKLLLQNKFDVNQRDKMGETPIFNACSSALKLLIERNCDVNVLNINGLNALNIVFNSECFSKSYMYMETEFKEIVKLLVDSDCSVNICDADGQTPLHRACSEGYVDEAELFLNRNSNINQCDKLMKTPLILAVEGGHTKVVTMLVENKCDIDISDKDDRTALDIAEENRVVDIKNILLNVMRKDTNAYDACTTSKKAKYF